MQRLGEERVRPEGRGDAAGQLRCARQRGGQVVGDVVAVAEQQRYEDGFAAQLGEGVGEQRPVQLDVPEPYGQAGAQRTDPVEQRPDGGQRAGVTAAVGDGDEGGARRFRRVEAPQPDAAELGAELCGDLGGEVSRAEGAEGRCGIGAVMA